MGAPAAAACRQLGRLAIGVGAGLRFPMADQMQQDARASTSGAMVARGNH
jgi:hypothetical protein